MASLIFLWQHRARFPAGSKKFYTAWAKRILCFPELLRRNYRRSSLIRKGAVIDRTAEIGEAMIRGRKNKLSVGQSSFIGRVQISLYDEVKIGNCVCINDGVEILTGSHDVTDPEWKHVAGKIIIDDYAWIGTGAMILPGVEIGRGAVIGARSVVTKSVPPGVIVAGNPAQPTSRGRANEFNYNPCEFLAANRAWLHG
jgi:acetyltransferase-like isoleucine patch superfamily enzyme